VRSVPSPRRKSMPYLGIRWGVIRLDTQRDNRPQQRAKTSFATRPIV
jgi:hypothetical protein